MNLRGPVSFFSGLGLHSNIQTRRKETTMLPTTSSSSSSSSSSRKRSLTMSSNTTKINVTGRMFCNCCYHLRLSFLVLSFFIVLCLPNNVVLAADCTLPETFTIFGIIDNVNMKQDDCSADINVELPTFPALPSLTPEETNAFCNSDICQDILNINLMTIPDCIALGSNARDVAADIVTSLTAMCDTSFNPSPSPSVSPSVAPSVAPIVEVTTSTPPSSTPTNPVPTSAPSSLPTAGMSSQPSVFKLKNCNGAQQMELIEILDEISDELEACSDDINIQIPSFVEFPELTSDDLITFCTSGACLRILQFDTMRIPECSLFGQDSRALADEAITFLTEECDEISFPPSPSPSLSLSPSISSSPSIKIDNRIPSLSPSSRPSSSPTKKKDDKVKDCTDQENGRLLLLFQGLTDSLTKCSNDINEPIPSFLELEQYTPPAEFCLSDICLDILNENTITMIPNCLLFGQNVNELAIMILQLLDEQCADVSSFPSYIPSSVPTALPSLSPLPSESPTDLPSITPSLSPMPSVAPTSWSELYVNSKIEGNDSGGRSIKSTSTTSATAATVSFSILISLFYLFG